MERPKWVRIWAKLQIKFVFLNPRFFFFCVAVERDEKRSILSRIIGHVKQHSLQELMAIWLPESLEGAVMLCIVVYVHEPRFKILPISIIPEESRSAAVLGIWILEELWFLMTIVALVSHATSLHVLSFEKYLVVLESITRSTSRQT